MVAGAKPAAGPRTYVLRTYVFQYTAGSGIDERLNKESTIDFSWDDRISEVAS